MNKVGVNNIQENILVIGAGSAGRLLIKDIIKNARPVNIVGIIDDDSSKHDINILGIRVLGGREAIIDAVKEYKVDDIYLALPSVDISQKNEILKICRQTNCTVRDLPSLYQFFDENISVKAMSEIDYDLLLGRKPINMNTNEVFEGIKGKTVMVTGGGGSIGSEICRQIASHAPSCLIVFDIYENNAYQIQQELLASYPKLNLLTLIGSIRDYERLEEIFNKYTPDIVYHAAAHKHVPLMEDSPKEAIKNNVFGTYNLAYVSLKHNVSKFVMISTDKAVNPTNIMGASKRICELIIQAFSAVIKEHKIDKLPVFDQIGASVMPISNNNYTCFVAVRFGNVLGSNGSVIPKFKWQIENGGPVTVTHPDIIRYFMTIREAVSLVLQAGTNAKNGEIYVLDMGEPVKILDLAKKMIKMSGYDPDKDIKIVFTGLRPGEKLYEEKLLDEEGLEKTQNELIHVAKPIETNTEALFNNLISLHDSLSHDVDDIIEKVKIIVPNFRQ